MKELLTAHSIANQIRMTRSQFMGSFVIVEGATDQRFFKRFIDLGSCQIVSGYGKERVLEVVDILEKAFFKGVLAIVDADFMKIEGNLPSSPNILLTDHHDVEMLILLSPTFEKFLEEFGSFGKISSLMKQRGNDVRHILLQSSIYLGYLRLYSLRQNINLRFEELDVSRFLDRTNLEVNRLTMIQTVKNHSRKPFLSDEQINQELENLIAQGYDTAHVCCGHDVIACLAYALSRTIGTHNTREMLPEKVEQILRIGYEGAYFQDTMLYSGIVKWEQANPPFRVLLKKDTK